MKKSTKLNLNDLKVESFVTSLDENKSNTVKAGTDPITDVVSVLAITLLICVPVTVSLATTKTGKKWN